MLKELFGDEERYVKLKSYFDNFMKVILSKHRISYICFILPVIFLILGQALFKLNGYISFGNFVTPISIAQFDSSFVFWNPYQFNGYPVMIPFIIIAWDLIYSFTFGLYYLVGPFIGTKLVMVLALIFLSYSFYGFTGELSKSNSSRILSTLFILVNPFEFELLANGDFYLFIYQSFVFLSIWLLAKGLQKSRKLNYYQVLSLLPLVFSITFYEAFLLGAILYIAIGIYIIFFKRENLNMYESVKDFGFFLLKFLMLIPMLLPFLYGFIFSPYNLSPNSVFSPSLYNFNFNSLETWKLLYLYSYPPDQGLSWGLSGIGFILNIIWIGLVFAIVTTILFSYVYLRKKATLFLTIIVILSSIIGSGSKGPLSGLTLYLFLHLPGYQTLNASYFWDWLLIIPLYSLILLEIFDAEFKVKLVPLSKVYLQSFKRNVTSLKARKILSLIFIVVLVLPIFVQSYYSQNQGIHDTKLPNSYYSVPSELKTLVGNSYLGVAYFNPDNYVVLGNTSTGFPKGFPNSFTYFPSVRTIGIPSYNIAPLESNHYFYWVYKNFYENRTSDLAQLMGVAGVKYFVVLYNTNSVSSFPNYMPWSYNVNASKLMTYQNNVKLIYRNNSYAIYSNELVKSVVYSARNLTLIAGDINSLNYLAKNGLNLTNQSLIFNTDLNPLSQAELLSHTSSVIFTSTDGLINLALKNSNLTQINPLNYLSSNIHGQGWSNSWRNSPTDTGIGIVDTSQIQFAVSNSNVSLNIPFHTNSTGDYNVWVETMYSSLKGGNLSIAINSESPHYVNTNISSNISTSGFNWVSTPVDITTTSNNHISITSNKGINGVRSIYVTKPGTFANIENNLFNLLRLNSIKPIFLYNQTHELNSIKSQVTPILTNVTLNQIGYSFRNLNHTLLLVRSPYFSTINSGYSNQTVLSGLSSMNTIIILSGKNSNIVKVSMANPTYFYITSLIATISMSFFMFISFRRGKT